MEHLDLEKRSRYLVESNGKGLQRWGFHEYRNRLKPDGWRERCGMAS